MRVEGFKWFAGGAGVLIAVALAVWWWPRGTGPGGAIMVSSNAPAHSPARETNTGGAATEVTGDLNASLRTAAADLANASDAAKQKQALALLRQTLASSPASEASAAIRRFLDSKMDAPTRQGFKIGAKGFLTEAPTLRTFLLDYLGQIDPAAAAEYARVILSSKDSPDEWAVALRNLATGDTSAGGRALLQQKAGEMLRYGPWQQEPSAGYLEAFDVAVYLGGTSLVPALGDLVRQQDNPAVAHAAYLALDRLVIKDPATTARRAGGRTGTDAGAGSNPGRLLRPGGCARSAAAAGAGELSARSRERSAAGAGAVCRGIPQCQLHDLPESPHPDAHARSRGLDRPGRGLTAGRAGLAGGPAVCRMSSRSCRR